MNEQDSKRSSVFGDVDQDEMIARLERAAPDETETDFFDQALQQPQPQAAERLVEGIRAFTGAEPTPVTPSQPAASAPPARGHATLQVPDPVTVVGPIGDDPAAARAFVLFGPAGVRRPA